MTDRPILFSGPMVRAILEGRKTQTRRVLKPQPDFVFRVPVTGEVVEMHQKLGFKNNLEQRRTIHPHCAVGDRLWVRETWAPVNNYGAPGIAYQSDSHVEDLMSHDDFLEEDGSFNYDDERITGFGKSGLSFAMWADDLFNEVPEHVWNPSIHMPRWASRITLEVTDVRVQRLREISEEDAKAEGPAQHPNWPEDYYVSWTGAFHALWNSLNEKRGFGWDVNPWVCAISFDVTTPEGETNVIR